VTSFIRALLQHTANRKLTGKTEQVLDWFHISMRLRPIEQMSSKIAIVAGDSDAELKQLLTDKLPRVRYQLWNGKSHAALERIGKIYSAT